MFSNPFFMKMKSYWFFEKYLQNTPNYPKWVSPILDPHYMPRDKSYSSTPYYLYDPMKYVLKAYHETNKMSGVFK